MSSTRILRTLVNRFLIKNFISEQLVALKRMKQVETEMPLVSYPPFMCMYLFLFGKCHTQLHSRTLYMNFNYVASSREADDGNSNELIEDGEITQL